MAQSKCCFCKSEAKYERDRVNYGIDCPICGIYAIQWRLYDNLIAKEKDSSLLWAISENIKHNPKRDQNYDPNQRLHWYSGDTSPESPLRVRRFENLLSLPIDHSRKPDQILRLIGKKTGSGHPFSEIELEESDLFSLKIGDEQEARRWILTLKEQALIIYSGGVGSKAIGTSMSVTPAGWQRIGQLSQSHISNLGFIAMFFGHQERDKLQGALESGCREAGFDATTIDRHEYVGGVVDEVVSKIRQSAFVIADLTGHRNGVYWESGYAEALDIPVIYTVDDREGDQSHFDVQHLNQIRWKSYEELTERVRNRILAVTQRREL